MQNALARAQAEAAKVQQQKAQAQQPVMPPLPPGPPVHQQHQHQHITRTTPLPPGSVMTPAYGYGAVSNFHMLSPPQQLLTKQVLQLLTNWKNYRSIAQWKV